MTFQPSSQQQAVFDAIAAGDHNILVDAKAGSGKTTTIVEGMRYIRRGTSLLPPSIVFLAFNKNIADTLKTKVPRGVSCSTFHSLGRRALVDSGIVKRDVKLEPRKSSKLVWNTLDRTDPDLQHVLRLIDVAKGSWPVDFESPSWWNDLIKIQDLSFEQPRRAVEVAKSVIEKTVYDFSCIDFSDMLFMPVFHALPFDPMDWIFVDEAQDLTGVQHEIVERLCRSTRGMQLIKDRQDVSETRICAVGDPHQAIYAFRGAHSDSMERLAERFSCKTYPLSVSYRCPKAVVLEAQKYLHGKSTSEHK